MSNFLWYLTSKREKQLKKLEEIPEYGKRAKSEIIEMALDEFILKHGASQNPQTMMELFENNLTKAIPNLYAEPIEVEKFYKLIKRKEEYKLLDEKINTFLDIHNKHLRRF